MANKPNPNINMVLSTYQGILSDPIPLETPMLISNETRLGDILLSSVAPKKPVKGEDGEWILEENTDDPFINKKYEIDFLPSGCAKPKGVEWFNDKPTNLYETTDRIFIP